jgi:alkylation response protein AidB-like acyl-CoA dehydrogenase
MANRHARTALEEALRYTQKRKTMGKTLIEHQAIRTKIAKMAMAVESSHQMVEHMTYQMIHMNEEEQRVMLAGMSALLKVQTCQTFEMCTREASQCMGGISYVRSGQGRKLVSLPVALLHAVQPWPVRTSRIGINLRVFADTLVAVWISGISAAHSPSFRHFCRLRGGHA